MKKHVRVFGIIMIILLATLACQISTGTTEPDFNTVNTQIALAMTQTAVSGNLSAPSATVEVQNQDPNLINTQVALAMTQTAMNAIPEEPTNTPTLEDKPLSQEEIEAMIDSANILTYEEIAGYSQYLPYVSRALDSVGGHQEYVRDAMGTFMDRLGSGTPWDLIIVAAEARKAISGDYWTLIKNQVDDGAALVAEMWYLDDIGGGKISPFLFECGVDVQADWWRDFGDDRLDYGMFWVEPDHPIFNTPNQVNRLGASLTDPAWNGDVGDFLSLRGGSDARILASHLSDQDSSYGLITTCMDGRVILQTFDSHDYPTNEMIALWENYITYTLTNHFLANH